jgi:hypothetical protein
MTRLVNHLASLAKWPLPKMSEDINELNERISTNLKTLIRGLTQNNLTEAYEGYKALFKIGTAAIPRLREAALKSNWAKIRRSNEIRYASGLMNLIHDIDESEAKRISNQLRLAGCDLTLVRILDSICRVTVNDYIQYVIRGVNIFEHKKLITKQSIRHKLERWLKNVPDSDLDEIERIFIIRRGDLEYLGNYTPVLYQINLIWDNPCSRWNPMSNVNNFIIQRTLYHEIGHHVCRHKFGQIPEQEKEAERYADRLMLLNSDNLLFRIARIVRRTFV